MKDLKVSINKDQSEITIILPFDKAMPPSNSGNTLLCASTRGAAESDVKVNGQNVRVNVNAYIYAKAKAPKEAA